MTRGDGAHEIIITGKPAAAILFGVLVFFAWRLAVTHDTVAPEVEEELRHVLAAEYAAVFLPDIEASLEQGDHARLREGAERLKTVMNTITFPSLKSRGGGNHFYVRAEILVDGGPPPKGKSLRYFQFSHSRLLGYVYVSEALAMEYYVPFMD